MACDWWHAPPCPPESDPFGAVVTGCFEENNRSHPLLAMLTLTTATSRLGDLPLDDEFRTEPIFNYEEPAPSGGVPLFFVGVQPYFID